MAPNKPFRTYSRDRRNNNSSVGCVEAFNILFAKNLTQRKLDRKVHHKAKNKFKFEIKELPTKIKTVLNDDSSLRVNINDTFDRLLKGPGKYVVSEDLRVNMVTNKSSFSVVKHLNSLDNVSPMICKLRSYSNKSITKGTTLDSWFDRPTPPGEAISNILEIEKQESYQKKVKKLKNAFKSKLNRNSPTRSPILLRSHRQVATNSKGVSAKSCIEFKDLSQETNNQGIISSKPNRSSPRLLRSQIATTSKNCSADKDSSKEAFTNQSNKSTTVSNQNAISNPIFTNSVREQILIHSSTPVASNMRKRLMGQALSPINGEDEIKDCIVESLEEIKSWNSSLPQLEGLDSEKTDNKSQNSQTEHVQRLSFNLEDFELFFQRLKAKTSKRIKLQTTDGSHKVKSFNLEDFEEFHKQLITNQSSHGSHKVMNFTMEDFEKFHQMNQSSHQGAVISVKDFESFYEEHQNKISLDKDPFFDSCHKSFNFITHRKHRFSPRFSSRFSLNPKLPCDTKSGKSFHLKDLVVVLDNNLMNFSSSRLDNPGYSVSGSISKKQLTVRLRRFSSDQLKSVLNISKSRRKQSLSTTVSPYKACRKFSSNWTSQYSSIFSKIELSRSSSANKRGDQLQIIGDESDNKSDKENQVSARTFSSLSMRNGKSFPRKSCRFSIPGNNRYRRTSKTNVHYLTHSSVENTNRTSSQKVIDDYQSEELFLHSNLSETSSQPKPSVDKEYVAKILIASESDSSFELQEEQQSSPSSTLSPTKRRLFTRSSCRTYPNIHDQNSPPSSYQKGPNRTISYVAQDMSNSILNNSNTSPKASEANSLLLGAPLNSSKHFMKQITVSLTPMRSRSSLTGNSLINDSSYQGEHSDNSNTTNLLITPRTSQNSPKSIMKRTTVLLTPVRVRSSNLIQTSLSNNESSFEAELCVNSNLTNFLITPRISQANSLVPSSSLSSSTSIMKRTTVSSNPMRLRSNSTQESLIGNESSYQGEHCDNLNLTNSFTSARTSQANSSALSPLLNSPTSIMKRTTVALTPMRLRSSSTQSSLINNESSYHAEHCDNSNLTNSLTSARISQANSSVLSPLLNSSTSTMKQTTVPLTPMSLRSSLTRESLINNESSYHGEHFDNSDLANSLTSARTSQADSSVLSPLLKSPTNIMKRTTVPVTPMRLRSSSTQSSLINNESSYHGEHCDNSNLTNSLTVRTSQANSLAGLSSHLNSPESVTKRTKVSLASMSLRSSVAKESLPDDESYQDENCDNNNQTKDDSVELNDSIVESSIITSRTSRANSLILSSTLNSSKSSIMKRTSTGSLASMSLRSTITCDNNGQTTNDSVDLNDSECLDVVESSIVELPRLTISLKQKAPILKAGKSWRRSLMQHKRDVFIDLTRDSDGGNVSSRLTENLRLSSKILSSAEGNRLRRKTLLQSYVSSAKGVNDSESDVVPYSDTPRKISLETSEPIITAKDMVLQYCRQKEPAAFHKIYPESLLRDCKKIGEGVYGEVFSYSQVDGSKTVMKIIPIEGDQIVNGEKQKKFHEILSEVAIVSQLSNLRNNLRNKTAAFCEVQRICCVRGKYPKILLNLWRAYDEAKGSENDPPDLFTNDQLYIVLDLGNGGQDLEAYVFNNASQAVAMFKQVSYALAVAEEHLQFEHRDLHWGNILLRTVDRSKRAVFKHKGKVKECLTQGVEVTIIDFTLSRIEHDGVVIFNDLGQDPDLFLAAGDYQFDIYRLMKERNNNDWQKFTPHTNILWLHYILTKSITSLRYKNTKTKIHKKCIESLKKYEKEILNFNGVREFVDECL